MAFKVNILDLGSFHTNHFPEPKDGRQYATILAALIAPQSRGNVTLNSADTNVLPTINTAYLQASTDQKVAIAAYKRVREAFASEFMQRTVTGEEYYPGKDVQSDGQILEVGLSPQFSPLWIILDMHRANMKFRPSKALSKQFGMRAVPVKWVSVRTEWQL